MIKVTTQKPTLSPNKVQGVFGIRADGGGRLFRKTCKSRNSLYAALVMGILKQFNRLTDVLKVNSEMVGSRAKCSR
jgi:hypothetical protein